MGDAEEVAAMAAAHPGSSAETLRDLLRLAGRVSITVADVERALGDRPNRRTPDRPDHRPSEPGNRGKVPPLYRWQADALSAWEMAGRKGVVEAVTGTGKTMVGLVATLDELARGGQVCILVPTRELLQQWCRLLHEVVPPGFEIGRLGDGQHDSLGRCDVLVAIVNSAAVSAMSDDLRPRRPGGLLIGDECHRYASERNRLALANRFPHRLGLSATYARPDDGHRDWLEPYFGPICFSMDYRRAIDEGVTARFRLAIVGAPLSPDEMAWYQELSETMASARAQLIGRHGVPADPIGAFLEAVGALARRGGYDFAAVAARIFLRAMQDRRQLLAESPAKAAALEDLVPAILASERAIVFTQTIEGAEGAASLLRDHGVAAGSVHSQLARHDRTEALTRFAAGDLQVVAAPQVLDEGIDVPAADLAIILASSRSRRQMVQRMGRVLRRKTDGRQARFVVVAAEGTIEDPRLGAHAEFLDMVADVAEEVAWFASPVSAAEVFAYLDPSAAS